MLETASHEKYVFGPYEADFQQRELRKSGIRIKIQSKPFAVLELLVKNQGQLISRERLRETLWPDDTVFVDFDKNLRTAVNKLREALCDSAEDHRYIETVPRFGYRFVASVQIVEANRVAKLAAPVEAPEFVLPTVKRKPSWFLWLGVVLFAVALSAFFMFPNRRQQTNAKSVPIVLADFENFTGDQVFNGALRRGLAFELKKSPQLNLISDARVEENLQLMERPKDSPILGNIASELCQRSGSAVTVEGSITRLGSQYVLVLKATNCNTGETLAQEQITADRQERVLEALGTAAARLQRRLNESAQSIVTPEAPPEAVTTPSMDALQAYLLGYRALVKHNESSPAIKFFQRAVEIDPKFAMAYARLGVSYGNSGQDDLAAENLRHAYTLRSRVSLRERFYIDARYGNYVTGDDELNRRTLEFWAESYPNDYVPFAGLGNLYSDFGEYEKSLEVRKKAASLSPSAFNYGNLASALVALQRFEEAKAVIQEGKRREADSPFLNMSLFRIAVLENDDKAAESTLKQLVGTPGLENDALQDASNVSAAHGRFVESRDLTSRAADSAGRAGFKETAGVYIAEAALREATVGNVSPARRLAREAIALSKGKEVEVRVALALALVNDREMADRLATKLESKYPDHTIIKYNYIPSLRAASALAAHDSPAALAISSIASPYELGTLGLAYYPIYLRGLSLLNLGESDRAVVEFQKILDHRGVVFGGALPPMAQLGIARAYVSSGRSSEAKAAYQAFFALWKDADADTLLLKTAKNEYARLQ